MKRPKPVFNSSTNPLGTSRSHFNFVGETLTSSTVRFDSAESFVVGTGNVGAGNTNFGTVAVHEIGHAIGIGHSTASTAIMRPTADSNVNTLQLDDIAAIQFVYGAPSAGYTGSVGNDTLYGGTIADTLSGGDGDDQISGRAGDDSLLGGGGGDLLDGGTGSDTLSGGDGVDTIAGSTSDLDTDVIADFVDGDVVLVQGADLSSLNGSAATETVTLGSGKSLTLSGVGSTNAVFTAIFDGTNTTIGMLTPSTVVTGTSGADSLTGASGVDVISGIGGNDTLLGLAGNDSLFGGNGDDSLDGGPGNDILSGGAGADSLAGAGNADIFIGTAAELANDTILVFDREDSIVVTGADLSALNGQAASSSIATGAGTLSVASFGSSSNSVFTTSFVGGNTTIRLADAPSSGGGAAPAPAPISPNGPPVVALPSISEPVAATVNVSGATIASVVPGSDLSRSFANNTAAHGVAPLISGGRVDATLPPSTSMTVSGPSAAQSAAGAQSFFAGAISNQLGGGASSTALNNSVALFTGSRAADVTIATRWVTPTASLAPSSPIVITGSTNGGSHQNALVIDGRGLPAGSQLNLDNIDFAALVGDMTAVGGAGRNFVVGDDGRQFISLGVDDDTLYGGGGDDTVGSAGGADLLFGDDGNDLMSGGTGSDSLFGGANNDLIYGNQDLDQISGGDGSDTIFAGQNTGVARVSDDGRLRQLDGVETIFGGAGGDLIYGNFGAEIVYGEADDDIFYGGQGDDTLYGGAGADILAGNRANDHLFGGAGADVFVFSNNGSFDVIHDFNLAEGDKIRVAANINGAGVATGADLLSRVLADASGNAVIDLGGGNSVQIVGIAPSQLTESAFEIG